MSDEERWFLEVLADNNWASDLRLIYADWLDEHERPDESREIREQVLRRLTYLGRYCPPLPWEKR